MAARSRRPARAPAAWPPPPHDPRERVCVATWKGWEVRAFPSSDARAAYLPMRGMGHVQLWHPGERVSVLTASRLTAGQIELFPIGGWKFPAADAVVAAAMLRQAYGLRLPGAARLAALATWFGGARRAVAGEAPAPGRAARESAK